VGELHSLAPARLGLRLSSGPASRRSQLLGFWDGGVVPSERDCGGLPGARGVVPLRCGAGGL